MANDYDHTKSVNANGLSGSLLFMKLHHTPLSASSSCLLIGSPSSPNLALAPCSVSSDPHPHHTSLSVSSFEQLSGYAEISQLDLTTRRQKQVARLNIPEHKKEDDNRKRGKGRENKRKAADEKSRRSQKSKQPPSPMILRCFLYPFLALPTLSSAQRHNREHRKQTDRWIFPSLCR